MNFNMQGRIWGVEKVGTAKGFEGSLGFHSFPIFIILHYISIWGFEKVYFTVQYMPENALGSNT
jgi:hypothetical protein